MASKSKKANPSDASQPALVCPVTSREPAEQARQFATFSQKPGVKAGLTVVSWQNRLFREANINEVVRALDEHGAKAASGDLTRLESMLAIQANTLDTLFNEYASLARLNLREHLNASETFMRLALKAQSQCRATIETLAAVKNPPAVAFVRQANIAGGHQQVNNGDAHARGNHFPANEVLETHERLDQREAQATGFSNPKVATLATIDRTKDAAGQTKGEPQQHKARREVA